MIKELFSLREEEIFNTIKELKDCDFVITCKGYLGF